MPERPDSARCGDEFTEDAWVLIANAYGGEWGRAPDDWRGAAERWRDRWFAAGRAAPPIPWGRVRELLLSDEAVDKAAHSLFDGVAAIERSATYAALAAAVDHAEKEER